MQQIKLNRSFPNFQEIFVIHGILLELLAQFTLKLLFSVFVGFFLVFLRKNFVVFTQAKNMSTALTTSKSSYNRLLNMVTSSSSKRDTSKEKNRERDRHKSQKSRHRDHGHSHSKPHKHKKKKKRKRILSDSESEDDNSSDPDFTCWWLCHVQHLNCVFLQVCSLLYISKSKVHQAWHFQKL